MKISNKALELIKGRKSILALALALDFTELWVSKLLVINKENGPLTTAKALQVIQEETGLGNEEILEEEIIGETNIMSKTA